MGDPTLVFALAIGVVLITAMVVGFLVYKGKLDWTKAGMLWAGLGAVLAALVAGWRAGRHTTSTKPAGGSQAPPEPTAGGVAEAQVVGDTKDKIEEIEDAEQDTDELERLRRLAQP